jgi:methanogenic corrinoid protein MtbC1
MNPLEHETTGLGPTILELIEARRVGRRRRYQRGEILYWQGSPPGCVYVVIKGKLKVYGISAEGKAHAYDILGQGRLAGATAVLLGLPHETNAEAMDTTEVYSIRPAQFEDLLATLPLFSVAVAKEQARLARSFSLQLRDLSFLDVQERLKLQLVRLAESHGRDTDRGVRIDLDITHKDIAELIGAHRSTVTMRLSELEQEGILWRHGRRLNLIPLEHVEVLDRLSQTISNGSEQEAIRWARRAVDDGIDLARGLNALASGMRTVDRGFARGDLALADVVAAALAMRGAMDVIEGEARRTGEDLGTLGTVVLGTVYGDIHDLGKTVVASLLIGEGFKVIDLGVNVPPPTFADAVQQYRPDILALSTLMSTTAHEPRRVVKTLEELGLRDHVKVIAGGGGVTAQVAECAGVDGYTPKANGVAELIYRLTSRASVRIACSEEDDVGSL